MLNRKCEVLEPFCLTWYQRSSYKLSEIDRVLEPFCLAWYQRVELSKNRTKVLLITTLNTFSVFIFTKIWHTINMNKVD